ncbi:MAG: ABC transporter permease [Pyrinomonadaceae bacterium]
MTTLLKDIRYGIRNLLKRPGFTVTAVITLALGIGANTAIFSLVNMVLLRSLPVDHPEQIVSVSARGKGDAMVAHSYPNYIDFRDRNEVLSGLLIYRFVPMSLSRGGTSERIWNYEVSGNYFDVLGVRAIKGRTFLPEEDRTRLSHPVAVVSYGCWQRRFGADPDLVGKEVLLNNHPFRIIGIAPEGFKGTEFVYTPEMWIPVAMLEWAEPGASWLDNRNSGNFLAVGRLKPGVDAKQGEASLNLLALQLSKEYPDTNEGQTISVGPPGFILPNIRGAVVSFTWILMAAVALVLLVTCTNLAGLLLARATDRRKEIAIRLAMGASRFRLIRQLLTESILLSVIGGAVGLWLALWIINALLAFKPPVDFPLALDVNVDWRVLIFSLTVSFLTGAVFGLVPALQATRPSLVTALKDTAAQRGGSRTRLRSGLVVAQIALSLVLLIGAGLVVRTLRHLQTMDPGFDPRDALTLSFDLGLQGYDQTRGEQFYQQLVERIQSLSGVRSVAVIVRTVGDPQSIITVVRNEIHSLDPNLPVFDVKTLTEHMRLALFPARVAASVLGVFGFIALTLAAIGIYGVTSYSVAQRTREIGIRMALGAQLGDVLRLILSHGLKLTVLGLSFGLLGAYLLMRAITSVLYGVSATDPLTFVFVSLLLTAVALSACYWPARRATKVDPLEALRYE